MAQTLSAGLPDNLPTTMRDALQALEQLDNSALEQAARKQVSAAAIARFAELREPRAGITPPLEQQVLDSLSQDADLRMLRKAYGVVLLKLRGQPIPTLTELDA
ncbi:MAG: hypothetical protein HGA45_21645 [Chloroflexales bacterium]|nr:hypothetical protein [Chloroflexales bacterium]